MKRLPLFMALTCLALVAMGAKKPTWKQTGVHEVFPPGVYEKGVYKARGGYAAFDKNLTAKVYGMNINTRDIEPRAVGIVVDRVPPSPSAIGIRIDDSKGRAPYTVTGGSYYPVRFGQIKGVKGDIDGEFTGDLVFKASPKQNEIREIVRFPAAKKTAILQLSEIKSFTVTTKAGKTERFTVDPKTGKVN